MNRIIPWAMAALLLVAAPAAAQSPSAPSLVPTEQTLCVTFLVEAGTTVDSVTLGQQITQGLVEVKSIVPSGLCAPEVEEPLAEDEDEFLNVPLGESMELDDWTVKITDVNSNAWKVVRRENSFNERPASGMKILLVTYQARLADDADRASPMMDVDFELVDVNGDVYDDYDGVVPRDRFLAGDVNLRGGGKRTLAVAFEIPTSKKLSDLILEVSTDTEYADFDLN